MTAIAEKIPLDPGDEAAMRAALGPLAVDQAARQLVMTCWMCLPEARRTIPDIDKEVRRIVERVLANLKEDGEVFGPTSTP